MSSTKNIKGASGVRPYPATSSSSRARDRFSLRESWNFTPLPGGAKPRIGPFRRVNNAGDILSRVNYSCGGPNMVNGANKTKLNKSSTRGLPSTNNCDGTNVEPSTCNVKYVYDSSDFTRFRKLQAINRGYGKQTKTGECTLKEYQCSVGNTVMTRDGDSYTFVSDHTIPENALILFGENDTLTVSPGVAIKLYGELDVTKSVPPEPVSVQAADAEQPKGSRSLEKPPGTQRISIAGTGATFTMYESASIVFGTIEGVDVVDTFNTGIYLAQGGSFTMDGGSITAENIVNGADCITLREGTQFIMDNGLIKINEITTAASHTNWYSVGITLNSSSSFTMNGGNIDIGTVDYSYGITLDNSSMTMNGGSITAENATNLTALLYLYDGSVFNMNKGDMYFYNMNNSDGIMLYQDKDSTSGKDNIFNANGGTISVENTTNISVAIYLSIRTNSTIGNVFNSSGTDIRMRNVDEESFGVYIEKKSDEPSASNTFNMTGGTLDIEKVNNYSSGIEMYDDRFIVSGEETAINIKDVSNGSTGIVIFGSQGSFIKEDGPKITISGSDGTGYGFSVYNFDGNSVVTNRGPDRSISVTGNFTQPYEPSLTSPETGALQAPWDGGDSLLSYYFQGYSGTLVYTTTPEKAPATAKNLPIVNTNKSFGEIDFANDVEIVDIAGGNKKVSFTFTFDPEKNDMGDGFDGAMFKSADLGENNFNPGEGVLDIRQFDGIPLARVIYIPEFETNGGYQFYGYQGQITAVDKPTIFSGTTMSGAFSETTDGNLNIGGWDVSGVTNMGAMFAGAISFNQDISSWDVSGVKDMGNMFQNATSFDQDIGGWDVSGVENMAYMFRNATSFNQDIGGWGDKLGNVKNMTLMFAGAEKFNQDISGWGDKLGNVKTMAFMFNGATSFNQDIGAWDVSGVEDMENMFKGATSFNQDIGGWGDKLGNVKDMLQMFEGAKEFNQDISGWDVSGVENMKFMFFGAEKFDCGGNIQFREWKVQNIEGITERMLEGATAAEVAFGEMLGYNNGSPEPLVFFNQVYDVISGTLVYTTTPEKTPASAKYLPIVNTNKSFGEIDFANDVEIVDIAGGNKKVSFTFTFDPKKNDMGDGLDGAMFKSADFLGNNFNPGEGVLDIRQFDGIPLARGIDFPDFGIAGVQFYKYQGQITSDDKPTIFSDTTMSYAFSQTTDGNLNIGHWDVSGVKNMILMFNGATSFNQDIGGWIVSNVENMFAMFQDATSFNQDIGGWIVSNVESMAGMFSGAKEFNQDIGGWDVSNVKNMIFMFYGASSFNQDIGGWGDKLGNVENMAYMFLDATSFNQDIGGWDVSGVENMTYMFQNATSFNQDIGGWIVSNVTNMIQMFNGATSFNQDISAWDVSGVETMKFMFFGAEKFDCGGNIQFREWKVQNIEGITERMLEGATAAEVAFGEMLGYNNGSPEPLVFFNQVYDVISGILVYTTTPEKAPATAKELPIVNTNKSFGEIDFANDVTIVDDNGNKKVSFTFTFDPKKNDMGDGFDGAMFKSADLGENIFNPGEGVLDIRQFDGIPLARGIDIPDLGIAGVQFYRYQGQITAVDKPTIFSGTTMFRAFEVTTDGNLNIGHWDMSGVTNMHSMFFGAEKFNQDIGGWIVSGVENMSGMFFGAEKFNQDISGWDVSNVKRMIFMFLNATSFNQDIGGWGDKLGNVENMTFMFAGAEKFNQDIGDWGDKLGNVKDMQSMFAGATSFNQDISSWDVSNVENMKFMFKNAEKFDCGGNIQFREWEVQNIEGITEGMFEGATAAEVTFGGQPGYNNGSPEPLVFFNYTGWDMAGQRLNGEQTRGLYLGNSVSSNNNGDIVAVGILGDFIDKTFTGYTEVYKKNNEGAWERMGQTLVGENIGDQFGRSVSLSGDGTTLAVGAPLANNKKYTKIYRYDTVDNEWKEVAKLEGENNFGRSVSLSGNGTTLAVSADIANNYKGYTKIYRYVENEWKEVAKFEGENEDDAFGFSVSLSSNGTTLAVGANLANEYKGYTKIYRYVDNEWTEIEKLEGEKEFNDFGSSVSLSSNGTTLAVGAAYANGEKGYTKIYRYVDNEWSEIEKLEGENEGDQFGVSVSLSSNGTTLAVGANSANERKGYTKIYRYVDNEWSEIEKLEGENEGDQFGFSVSLSGDENTLAVGAPFANNTKGYANIYTYNGNEYTDKITINNTILGDRFGRSVSLSGDGTTLAVAAYSANEKKGYTKIYRYVENEWSEIAKLEGENEGDNFGVSVSLSSNGTTLAVGADLANERKGYTKIYRYVDNTWTQIEKLEGEKERDGFGRSVSLSSNGTTLAVGAAFVNNKGYTKIYRYVENEWSEIEKLEGENIGDSFGISVSLSGDGNTVAVGAFLANERKGYTKIYRYVDNTWTQIEKLEGENESDDFGASVSLSSNGTTLAVGAYRANERKGYTKIYRYVDNTWTQIAKLEGENEGNNFGWSVSLSSDGNTVAVGAFLANELKGYTKIYSYVAVENEWVQVGKNLVGETEGDLFGWSVSLSSDGRRVAIGSIQDEEFTDIRTATSLGYTKVFDYQPL